jgi:predicted nucleotidyltransferase component of viral defense system
MTNWLKLEDKEQLEIIQAAAAEIGLPQFVVEKDLWVTFCLGQVFSLEAAGSMVFKGGTSLSKGWDIIERFSEDIDLAIGREFLGFSGELSRTQVNKLRKATQAYVSDSFFKELNERMSHSGVEITLQETDVSDQDPFKVFVNYKNLTEHTAYVKPTVTLEIGGRSSREPFTELKIQSLIAKQYAGKDFVDDPVTVPTVNVERTFLEKLFLLHENFKRPAGKIHVERLSRHLYDIHKISATEYAPKAIKDQELFKSIVTHRKSYTPLSGVDYTTHYPPNLNPIPPDDLLKLWEKDYNTMREEMIQGESPSFSDLIKSVKKVADDINANK